MANEGDPLQPYMFSPMQCGSLQCLSGGKGIVAMSFTLECMHVGPGMLPVVDRLYLDFSHYEADDDPSQIQAGECNGEWMDLDSAMRFCSHELNWL